ncbi:hypothetical protein KSW81_003184 [Nannochloris sp. 'desiccata']|nr:hypothetical protein KSW81_003184 [Chlorella desiccata (nom. nud.)]
MPTRIPRPGASVPALQPLDTNIASNRKRKDILSDDPTAPPEELSLWEAAAAEMGWTPADCLQHKISFAKRCDEKKKVETLAAHLKRLRAVGWHLYEERDQAEAKIAATEEELKAEKTSRAKDANIHEEAAQLAQIEAESLQKKLESSEAEAERRSRELQSVSDELAENLGKLKQAEEAHTKVEKELASQEAAAAALQQRLQAAETAAADSQKYNSQLQEYNSKMQSDLAAATKISARLQDEKAGLAEEAASLRGRVDALGDALSALQAANSSSESVRQAAAEEAARLRADLASACAERNSLSADVARLRGETDAQRKELERFRAVTGKDVAALEAERASSAALVNRTEAQAATLSALQDQVALLKEQRNAAEALSDSKTDVVRTLTARVAELEALLSSAEQRIRDGEATRRRLHNTILELKGNVRVFCRVRPPTTDTEDSKLALAAPQEGDLAGRGVEIAQAGNGGPSTKGPQRHVFTFDKVFGPSSGQCEVFEEVSMLVQSALDGYRVTVFAYGQTNAGKTHTMLGRPGQDTEGIIPRAVRQVFSTAAAAAEQGWNGSGGKPAANGTSVSYLEWVDVNNEEKVSTLLQRAMNQRAVGATASNEQSSRSHMVFMLTIEGSNETTGQKMSGALNLVDLAGSERLARSGASGERLKETQAINKSLSALGDVIAALGARESHVPYRNSKLTFLLQNSLSGAGKALMLCNVSPAVDDAPESLCTLRFAAKVNATEIGTARRNVVASTK